jgi:hypothetical protein
MVVKTSRCICIINPLLPSIFAATPAAVCLNAG